MAKKKSDRSGSRREPAPSRAPKRPTQTPPPLDPLRDDLTTAEILAATPAKPRRARKRETAKSLGVYDADRDILDQYLYEVSQTPLLTQPQEIAIARKVRTGDAEAGEAQPPFRHFGSQEVSEPGTRAHRPDRRRQRRAAHGRAEVRSGSGREVHLLRRLVDSPGHSRRPRTPRPHCSGTSQPDGGPFAHHPHRGEPAAGVRARTDSGRDRKD